MYTTFLSNWQDAVAQQTAKLIYQTALLESGFLLEDPKEFASRIYSVMRTNLNISPDATVEEEEEEVEVEETTETSVEDHKVQNDIGSYMAIL